MLTKDYLRNKHSRLIQMSAQPNPPSGSSEGRRKEILHRYTHGSQHMPDFLVLASMAKLHLKALAMLGNALKQIRWALRTSDGVRETPSAPAHLSQPQTALRESSKWHPARDFGWTVRVTLFWEINLWDGWSQFWITLLPSTCYSTFFLAALPVFPATLSAGKETAEVLGSDGFAQSPRNYH